THSGPPRPESTRGRAILYSILLPGHRHCGRIPRSFRWRVLDPRTGQAQATGLKTRTGERAGVSPAGAAAWRDSEQLRISAILLAPSSPCVFQAEPEKARISLHRPARL